MSPETAILSDLSVSQSTADSIAGRISRRTAAVDVILRRLAAEDLVTRIELVLPGTSSVSPPRPTGILVWKLTTAGHDRTRSALKTEN